MVRKHYPWTRQRSKRTRPKTPAPTTGWVISELARITELPVRRIRYYVEHALIRPLEVRGTATRYQRRELLRLLAIRLVRTDKTWKLEALKRELDRLGESELERLVLASPLSPAAAKALGVSPPNLPSAVRAEAGNMVWAAQHHGPNPEGIPGESDSVQLWHHVVLLPGLELLVSSRASPAVRNAARKIYDEFLG